jgi:hypothetical protein
MDNAFLASFLKARQSMLVDTGKKTESKPATATVTLQTIVDDCPGKAKVLEYLKQRIAELEEDEF